MDARGVAVLLKARLSAFPTQEKAAWRIGVGMDHLNAVLNGRCPPGPKILKFLGLKRRFVYEYDGLPKFGLIVGDDQK